MIVFTGSGALATSFAAKYACRQVSARQMADEELLTIFHSASAIVHNAALIQSADLHTLISANTLLTKRLLDLAYEVNPHARFVYISSMSMLHSAARYLPVNQMTAYSLSKYFAEQYVLHHQHPDKTTVKFSTLFYRDALRDGLSKLAVDAVQLERVELINKGTASRDFIPLETAVEYLHKIITADIRQDCWMIASGQPTTFAHYAGLAKKQLPALIIDSLDQPNRAILADFPARDMERLGRIPIDMDRSFTDYIRQLHANNDL